MKSFLPIVLIVAAVGLFFTFTTAQYNGVSDGSDPAKKSVKELKKDNLELTDALNRSTEILKKRSELQKQFAKFTDQELESIEKLLPDNVDNVQLILDINGIARNHGMVLKGIKIGAGAQTTASADGTPAPAKTALGPDKSSIGSLTLSFNVSATYDDFITFLKDLEQSLRIVDITSLSFRASDKDKYDYAITIKTYWLK